MAHHKPLKDYLACVAVDIGSTGTGYAYSTRDDFRADQLDVTLNEKWTEESQGSLGLKAPTCLLLDPTMQFHAFGYEAENKYAELAAEELHEDWYYFERFKMQLFKNEVSIAPTNNRYQYEKGKITSRDQSRNPYIEYKIKRRANVEPWTYQR